MNTAEAPERLALVTPLLVAGTPTAMYAVLNDEQVATAVGLGGQPTKTWYTSPVLESTAMLPISLPSNVPR